MLGEGFRKRAGLRVGDVGRVYAGVAGAVAVGAGACKSAYTYVSADKVAEVLRQTWSCGQQAEGQPGWLMDAGTWMDTHVLLWQALSMFSLAQLLRRVWTIRAPRAV